MTAQSISSGSRMLDHALDHARVGLPVFPCRLDKSPYLGADRDANGDKIEKTGGLYKATTDQDTITVWWTQWPNAMIGLRMGKASGLFAIDPDAPKEFGDVDGRIELAKLEGRHGMLDTLTTNTPGKGNHKFFNFREDRPISNAEGALKGLGINVRGEGGYVIVPPSVRADGRAYEYDRTAQYIADAPDWLYDLIAPRSLPIRNMVKSPPLVPDDEPSISERAFVNVIQLHPARNERGYSERALKLECDALAATREGSRNAALNTAALKLGQLIGPGRLSESEVRARLEDACHDNGLLADGKAKVRATINSGLFAGMKTPRIVPDRAVDTAGDESDVDRLNKLHAVLPIGGKTRVVTFGELVDFPGRETIVMTQTLGDFQALHNKYRHTYTDKSGVTQNQPMGNHWINSQERRQYDGGMAFMPQLNAFVGNRLNLWNGFGVKPIKPDGKSGAAGCQLFLDFMCDVICSGDQATFGYLRKREAFILQKRTRSEVALGLHTEEEGCGKGFYEKTMGRLLGDHAMQVSNPKHIVGAFNPHLETLLRLTADEALFVGSHEHRNALFGLITEPKLTIEPKGCNLYTADSFLNLSITSNAAHFLPVSGTARRFLIPKVSAIHMQDFVYFNAIQSQLDNGGYEALLYHFLHEVDLTDFNVRLVPQTEALREQRNHSLSPLEAWWCELLETGTLMGADPAAPHRAVSNAYQRLVEVDGRFGTAQSRYVNQLGIYDQARLIEPRLRNHFGDHKLAAHLTAMGGDNTKKVLRRRGYTLPPLLACRAAWDTRFPGWQWRDTEITEWRAEEADDEVAVDDAGHVDRLPEPAF